MMYIDALLVKLMASFINLCWLFYRIIQKMKFPTKGDTQMFDDSDDLYSFVFISVGFKKC